MKHFIRQYRWTAMEPKRKKQVKHLYNGQNKTVLTCLEYYRQQTNCIRKTCICASLLFLQDGIESFVIMNNDLQFYILVTKDLIYNCITWTCCIKNSKKFLDLRFTITTVTVFLSLNFNNKINEYIQCFICNVNKLNIN